MSEDNGDVVSKFQDFGETLIGMVTKITDLVLLNASLEVQLAERDALIERLTKADGTAAEKWRALIYEYRATKAKETM